MCKIAPPPSYVSGSFSSEVDVTSLDLTLQTSLTTLFFLSRAGSDSAQQA